jgi:hypothetical protein
VIAVLDAVRLGPDDDEAEVTAAQVREVVTRPIAAEHWREGDPAILVIFRAGYDVTRLAYLFAGLPARLLGRRRSPRSTWEHDLDPWTRPIMCDRIRTVDSGSSAPARGEHTEVWRFPRRRGTRLAHLTLGGYR